MAGKHGLCAAVEGGREALSSLRADEISTLVLLPGMDGTGELFARFAKELAPFFALKIIAYPATKPMGYAALLDLVVGQLPAEGRYAVLAESFSGPLGIELAARAPDRLAKLILCCTFARNPRPSLRALLPLLPLLPMKAVPVSWVGRVLMGSFFEPELQADLARAMSQLQPDVMRARAQAVLEVDVLARLQAIRVPTLYLQAKRDSLMSPRAADQILAVKPDVQLQKFDGPHFLLQTKPAEAALIVKQFLST